MTEETLVPIRVSFFYVKNKPVRFPYTFRDALNGLVLALYSTEKGPKVSLFKLFLLMVEVFIWKSKNLC